MFLSDGRTVRERSEPPIDNPYIKAKKKGERDKDN